MPAWTQKPHSAQGQSDQGGQDHAAASRAVSRDLGAGRGGVVLSALV